MARPNRQSYSRNQRNTCDHANTQPSIPRPRGPRATGRSARCERDPMSAAEKQQQQQQQQKQHTRYRNGGGGGGRGGGRKDNRGSLHQGSRRPRGDGVDVAVSPRGNSGKRRNKQQQQQSRKACGAVNTDGDETLQLAAPCANCEAVQLQNQQLYKSIAGAMVGWAREVGVDTEGDRDATASVDTEEMEWQQEHVFIIPADHRKVTDSELLGLENARLGLTAAGGLARPGIWCNQLVAQPYEQVGALAAPAPALHFHQIETGFGPDNTGQWVLRQGIIPPVSVTHRPQLPDYPSRMQLPLTVDAATPKPQEPLSTSIDSQRTCIRQRY